jgi:hypothetical protein
MLQVLELDIALLSSHKNTEREVSFQDLSESDSLTLLLSSPEYPFGETSSSPLDPVLCGEEPPVSQLPWLQQDDLDRWLHGCCSTLKEENTRNM